MALIKCPQCRRYMGTDTDRCIYCGEKFHGKPIPVIEADAPKTPAKPKKPSLLCRVLIALAGLLLIAGGFLLLSPLPLLAIPLVLLGGWLLTKI